MDVKKEKRWDTLYFESCDFKRFSSRIVILLCKCRFYSARSIKTNMGHFVYGSCKLFNDKLMDITFEFQQEIFMIAKL